MVKGIGFSVFAVVGCLALSVPALADVDIYNNGPINGNFLGFTIADGFAVSDSFTVSSASTITGVTFGDWAFPGAPPSTVQWAIGSSEEAGDLGSGTGSLSNVFFLNNGGYDVYSSSFSVPNISLAAGTYWLTLSNSSPDPQYWDMNNGPSAAFQNGGNLADEFEPGTNSESFDITGQAGTGHVTPEPSFQIVGAGLFACIGAGAWLRRRKMTEQAKS